MSHFSKLKKQLKKYLDKTEVAKIQEAYSLAEKAHASQKRQSGEPYIIHPVAVATTLADIHMDAQTIMAALLHDVIEDTSVEKNEITEKFGSSVAALVDGVSKLTQISFANKAEAQAENFRKMILAMTQDLRVIIVKLADRLHNMQTLEVVSAEKRRRVAKETLEIYTPLANRLGMHRLRIELEDLCFAALYPQREKTVRNAVRRLRGNRKEIVKVIEQAITDVCKRNKLSHIDVTGREKHLYSIYKKMRDRHQALSEIMDVYAFRILVDTVEDCYRVLGYVHNLYKPVPERFKDYIAIPKANGYQSLHTTLFGPYGVPIEIQIRTHEMHEMAEYGIAAHWVYKSEEPLASSEAQVRAQAWMKNLLEMQKSSANPMEFVENVKIDLFPDEVYVFTPKGNILELPHGATPVDFAYAVHTDLGNTCVAAKIDRKYALLSTPLVNGQTVDIISAKTAHPNPAWLDFVVTGKARSTIRHYFKKQRRSESVDLGNRLLTNALAKHALQLEEVPALAMQRVLQQSDFSTQEQLLEAIGLGNYTAKLVACRLHEAIASLDESSETGQMPQDYEPMAIRGTEGVVVNLAKCCHPIPGDPIVGRLTSGKGMVVHAEVCGNVREVKEHPEQFIQLRWAVDIQQTFSSKIAIEADNRLGILIDLTTLIAKESSNIEDLYMHSNNEYDKSIVILLTVEGKPQLVKLMQRLENIKGVSKVKRVRT